MPRNSLALDLLDESFVIDSDDDRVVELMRWLWSPFVSDGGDDGRIRYSVSLADDSWSIEYPDEGPAGWASDGEGMWRLALTLRYALVDRARRSCLEPLLLHASAVADDRGAVLFAAPNAGGKTTLALNLARRGWRYLTDDLAPVTSDMHVRGFPKPLGIRADGSQRWGEWAERLQPPGWLEPPAESWLMPATSLQPESGSVPVVAVAFPEFSSEAVGVAVEPVSDAEAIVRLGEQAARVDAETIPRLRGLVQGVPTIRLNYGPADDVVSVVEKGFVYDNDPSV